MNLNIRNKLIIFAVVAIIVPLGLAALVILFQLSAFTSERSKERIQSDARVSQSIFAKRQENLRAAAQSAAQAVLGRGLVGGGAPAPAPAAAPAAGARPAEQPAQPSSRGLQDFLEAQRKGNQVSFVVLLDTRGKVVAQHNGPPTGDGNYFKDSPLFTDVNNQPQEGPRSTPRVEEAAVVEALGLKDRATVKGIDKALFLEAAAPVTSGDNVRGVILMGQLVNNDVSADASGQQSIVNEIKDTLYPNLREDAAAIVALGDTIVSTNLPGSEQGGGKAEGQKALGSGGSIQQPSFNEQNFLGGEYITSYVPVTEVTKGSGTHEIGRIGVAIKQTWFTAIVSRVRWTIIIVTAIALIVAIIAAVVAAAQLTKPIIELTEAANRISLGELDVPITVASKDEIGTLGEALDRMRISLKQAIERLRKR
jgi:HAMP domain-containing protein